MQKISIVCSVWTIAYIIKVFAVKYGTNYLLNDPDTTVSTQAAFGVGLTDFLTLTVPFYCVCDYDFVKTLAAKHLISEGEKNGSNLNLRFTMEGELSPSDCDEAVDEQSRLLNSERLLPTDVNPSGRALSGVSASRQDQNVKNQTTVSRASDISKQAILSLKNALEERLFIDEKSV